MNLEARYDSRGQLHTYPVQLLQCKQSCSLYRVKLTANCYELITVFIIVQLQKTRVPICKLKKNALVFGPDLCNAIM